MRELAERSTQVGDRGEPRAAGGAPPGRPLAELAGDLGALAGDGSVCITHLTIDSRSVRRGSLFVALRGLHTDGHRFLDDAVARGAQALVVEQASAAAAAAWPLPVVRVPATDRALARIAARFWRHPSRQARLLGVTGTNGKTTVTHLLAAALEAAGCRTALLGTLGAGFPGQVRETGYTTPTAERFQAELRRLVDGGAEAIAAEVSSHALATRRTYGSRFAVVGFTNLSRDHLDFHAGFDDYLAAKLGLFDRRERGDPTPATAVVNLDDPAAARFAAAARAAGDRLVTVGCSAPAAVRAAALELGPDGSRFEVTYPGGVQPVRLRLAGTFNVQNALLAFAMATAAGAEAPPAAAGLAAVRVVPGRLERVDRNGPVPVFVDYAHTPDALETVLATVRGVVRGRLIVVFGCGGDRDRGKRPLMAAAGARFADLAVLTSDNPRSEDPAAILADMQAGVRGSSNVLVVADRRQAIRRAVELARPGDSIVVAGKGHEPVQIVGDRALEFDDRRQAASALADAGLLGEDGD